MFWAPENQWCLSTTTARYPLSSADPNAATLVDGAAKALESMAAQCPVAILSGRDLADIRSRVAIPGIWYAGSHGFELTEPDGTYHQNEAALAAVSVLERAAAELDASLAGIPGVRVEHKRFAVAVHYREVAPQHIGEIISATNKLGQRDGLRVTSGRMLVELRPDLDWDKGTTLAWIRDRIDATGSLLPIYIGDDLTDEDAFDAVQFDGIGIVGAARRGWRPQDGCPFRSAESRSGAGVRPARVELAGEQAPDVGQGLGFHP